MTFSPSRDRPPISPAGPPTLAPASRRLRLHLADLPSAVLSNPRVSPEACPPMSPDSAASLWPPSCPPCCGSCALAGRSSLTSPRWGPAGLLPTTSGTSCRRAPGSASWSPRCGPWGRPLSPHLPFLGQLLLCGGLLGDRWQHVPSVCGAGPGPGPGLWWPGGLRWQAGLWPQLWQGAHSGAGLRCGFGAGRGVGLCLWASLGATLAGQRLPPLPTRPPARIPGTEGRDVAHRDKAPAPRRPHGEAAPGPRLSLVLRVAWGDSSVCAGSAPWSSSALDAHLLKPQSPCPCRVGTVTAPTSQGHWKNGRRTGVRLRPSMEVRGGRHPESTSALS